MNLSGLKALPYKPLPDMFEALRNHPFAVEAFFESSLIVTFAVPKAKLAALVPAGLSLDTFQDQWAFITLALVNTTGLRPEGFPRFMGHNFCLIGYRIFVRYTNAGGKNLRGLYILRSETDKKRMQLLGSLFSRYNYTTTDIQQTSGPRYSTVTSRKSGLQIKYEVSPSQEALLPAASPFENWQQARRFAGPLPFTFSVDLQKKEVLIIEGVRQHWVPEPVNIIAWNLPYLAEIGLGEAILASAFIIKEVPYHWKKGFTELWNG